MGISSVNFSRIVESALNGEKSKQELADLLRPEKRQLFLEVCASIELVFTKSCGESGKTCLEDGCAMSEEEICLNPILVEGPNYYKAITHVWMELVNIEK